jgi:hypothetical protein
LFVRILFDQGTPAPIRNYLAGHEVSTAAGMGWSTLSNGGLLDTAEKEFDVLVTTDQVLKPQQDLSRYKLGIVVLPFASWPKLQPHADRIASRIGQVRRGEYCEIEIE